MLAVSLLFGLASRVGLLACLSFLWIGMFRTCLLFMRAAWANTTAAGQVVLICTYIFSDTALELHGACMDPVSNPDVIRSSSAAKFWPVALVSVLVTRPTS